LSVADKFAVTVPSTVSAPPPSSTETTPVESFASVTRTAPASVPPPTTTFVSRLVVSPAIVPTFVSIAAVSARIAVESLATVPRFVSIEAVSRSIAEVSASIVSRTALSVADKFAVTVPSTVTTPVESLATVTRTAAASVPPPVGMVGTFPSRLVVSLAIVVVSVSILSRTALSVADKFAVTVPSTVSEPPASSIGSGAASETSVALPSAPYWSLTRW